MQAPGTIKSVGLSPDSKPVVKGAQYPLVVVESPTSKFVGCCDFIMYVCRSSTDGNKSLQPTDTFKNGTPVSSPQFNKRNSGSQSRPDTPSTVRLKKFEEVLNEDNIDLSKICNVSQHLCTVSCFEKIIMARYTF